VKIIAMSASVLVIGLLIRVTYPLFRNMIYLHQPPA
jgi:hypothetical protein